MHPGEASSAPLRVIPDAVQRLLLRIPPLSHAAARLYALSDENADLREIGALISTDPSLSALLLRLVNSPLFGVRQPVTGILQAVALLGLNRVRVLATTAALRMLVSPATASPTLTRCWRHSLACALATRDIAANSRVTGDAAYTAGLLHDIGCIAMLSCWPREYSRLLATCQPADTLEREFESLAVTHTDAGAFLLQKWGLPQELAVVARDHHCCTRGRQSSLVELVSEGCHIADSLGFSLTTKSPDALERLAPDHDTFWLRIADGINQLDCL
jgi:HD-like signal output (HDOD) protein